MTMKRNRLDTYVFVCVPLFRGQTVTPVCTYRFPEMEEEEEDMLDLAVAVKDKWVSCVLFANLLL